MAVLTDEELAEVPGDLTNCSCLVVVERRVAAEESENIVSVVSIHVDLVEHGVLGAILGAGEVLNPSVIVGLLAQELVAGEG